MASKCADALKVILNYDDANNRIIYVDLASSYKEFLNSLESYGYLENMYKYWIDDDNDKIEIKGDKSYKMFIKIATKKRIFIDYKELNIEEKINNLNLKSREKGEEKSYVSLQDVEIHEQVECNGCKLFPILGLRYKCIVCPDYDLCMACTNKRVHSHHKMMRISSGQDYLFALKEQELNNKQNENISQSSIANNSSSTELLNLGKSWYEHININMANANSVKKISLVDNDISMLNEQETVIPNNEYSMLDDNATIMVNEGSMINRKISINNEISMSDENPLIVDKETSNKNEIFINWNKMFSKISNVLGNIINIDTEINKNSKILTPTPLANDLPKIKTASTSTQKYDDSIINDQNTYDPFTVVEILKNFNKMFSKISNALGNKIDIDNEINENHNILNIESNEEKFEDKVQQVDVLFTFGSNIFLEILKNFNEMFSKIFNALEPNNDSHNIIEEMPPRENEVQYTIDNHNASCSSTNHDSIMETENAYKEPESKIPKIDYHQLSRSLYNADEDDEINKSVNEIIDMGYENEDGWIENLLESFNGDVVRAKDFLKPVNETFD